jgi:hypothetical protein
MLRGVRLWIFGAIAGAALIALAGCGHNFYSGERETWRDEAEVACLNSGAIKESPARVRISAINGPGICGPTTPSGYRRSARADYSATATSRCARRPRSPLARRRSIGLSSNRAPCLRTSRQGRRRNTARRRPPFRRGSHRRPLRLSLARCDPQRRRHRGGRCRFMRRACRIHTKMTPPLNRSRRTLMVERCQDGEARRRRPATRSEIPRPRTRCTNPCGPASKIMCRSARRATRT